MHCRLLATKPLLVRHAWQAVDELVDGDDLAGIACEYDGDARLVFASGQDWRAEHGPFDETTFAALPEQGWTLLVQAVDQWIPEVGELLSQFAFLPRWRLDDIMVSYATPGGGVGPHFDYYDVFLLQVHGRREWKIGQACDAHSPLRDNPDMKLLRDFHTTATHVLDAGDMLYLPAGIAHWGTAMDTDCITLSVGFRAPSRNELLEACGEAILPDDDIRYRDTPESIDTDPWRINEAVINNLQQLCAASHLPREQLLEAFGCMVTEPRYPERIAAEHTLSPEPLTGNALRNIGHNPASRFSYYSHHDQALLFVDGQAHATDNLTAQGICHGSLQHETLTGAQQALLLTLVKQGSLLP